MDSLVRERGSEIRISLPSSIASMIGIRRSWPTRFFGRVRLYNPIKDCKTLEEASVNKRLAVSSGVLNVLNITTVQDLICGTSPSTKKSFLRNTILFTLWYMELSSEFILVTLERSSTSSRGDTVVGAQIMKVTRKFA
ncbi:predicted protein [Sclerotinia sclerotiorum 1980 UF-70]|uniref:Uncharacterized protein n=1 Tax=Sclerotinia sclerotiorum (strain ATCC 18683 / 1980 / Ss-1) TaxID=665079 RepID=A7ERI9_SCLS1|nr:predicted protein [Sclerotinia sclerotiorum 1980 UF-70]EDN92081.1 predicted protein [Sclerotinia sclerotiorum 1980 UF-70]